VVFPSSKEKLATSELNLHRLTNVGFSLIEETMIKGEVSERLN
jgi:hypothetical protein